MTENEYNVAVERLLDAAGRGGGTAERVKTLFLSLATETAGPPLGALMRNADAANRAAILATLDGHARFGLHPAVEAFVEKLWQNETETGFEL